MTMPRSMSRAALRRSLYWVLGTGMLGGVAAVVLTLPSATAASDPCAASEIARTIGSVSTSTGGYLDAHPATNAALTSASQQQPAQALATLKSYFDANPQAGKDLGSLQQPLQNLAGQCKLPISIPQALQLIQGGQLPGGLTLPGGTTPGGTTAGGITPSQLGATTPGTAPAGPLPGPATPSNTVTAATGGAH